MNIAPHSIGLSIAAALVVISVGCTSQQQQPAQAPTAPPDEHSAEDHRDAKIDAAMAKLSPADRKLAEQQKICPVSGEPLGSMGTPIKVAVEGREVFVCCEGCVDEIKENFDKYAAKLDQQS